MAKIIKANNYRDEDVIVVRATHDIDYNKNRTTFAPEIFVSIAGESAVLSEKETLTLISVLTKALEEARAKTVKRQTEYDKAVAAQRAKDEQAKAEADA